MEKPDAMALPTVLRRDGELEEVVIIRRGQVQGVGEQLGGAAPRPVLARELFSAQPAHRSQQAGELVVERRAGELLSIEEVERRILVLRQGARSRDEFP